MRTTKHLALATMASAALALWGCGGGGGGTKPPAPPSLGSLIQQADDARVAAEKAKGDAEKAQTDAAKYAGMLGITHTSVNGDSEKAKGNAQTALDKAKAAKTAHAAAKAAHESAQDAYDKAKDDADAAALADIKADLDAAKAAMDAAKDALDAANEAVEDLDPAKIASGIAAAMNTALMDGATLGTLPDADDTTPLRPTDAPADSLMDNDEDVAFSDGYAGQTITLTVTPTGSANPAGTTYRHALALAGLSDLTATDVANVTIAANNANRATSGNFRGVPGNYVCDTGKACSTRDADNNLVLPADLYFVPTDPASPLDGNDPVYAQYGYWLGMANNAYEVYTYQGVFGSALDQAGVQDLEGTATFTGDAMGFFVRETFAANGTPTPDLSGEFTAVATLTANFGGNSIAADDHDRISGTVSNFMHGDTDLGWTVTLGMVNLASSAVDFNGNGTTDATDDIGEGEFTGSIQGATSAGANGAAGRWFGSFYRDSNENTDHPDGVVGRFDAHPANGHIAGVFNADNTAAE